MSSSSLETGHCQRNKEVVASRDSISSLPDDLLIHILLLVPTKDAVATMVLSKRWRYLWTLVPKLEYNDTSDDQSESVWKFLENLLELHEAPLLETLCIKLGRERPIDVDVWKLVANAVDRFVRNVELELLWTSEPTILPKSLYTCKTLVELTLSNKILVDVPSPACLPSLKLLCLFYVEFKDEDSLERLVSSCSLLARSNLTLGISDNCNPRIDLVCNINDKFLRAISLVTTLLLPLKDPMVLSGITFSRLDVLMLCPLGHLWLDLIPPILNNTPKLTTLIINTICLMKVRINLTSTFNHEEEEMTKKELKSMPRVLTTCKFCFE
ncbi:hypothetical protein CARUB_v10028605mg [Capsella rubella]|uniref:F-box domain-containing protein n=1 Tax=Capsella rubella TaxID=81985 RepID=R0GEP5_9BRAS|nr:hypothetical protein CARUB_v10028605mg [Capsella rubella]